MNQLPAAAVHAQLWRSAARQSLGNGMQFRIDVNTLDGKRFSEGRGRPTRSKSRRVPSDAALARNDEMAHVLQRRQRGLKLCDESCVKVTTAAWQCSPLYAVLTE